MHARLVRYEDVSLDNWEIGRNWFTEDYLPVAMQTDGFSGAYLLHDDERMCTVSVTLWTDAETEAASGEAVQQHLDAWEQMTGIKATVETYEVVFAELPARAALLALDPNAMSTVCPEQRDLVVLDDRAHLDDVGAVDVAHRLARLLNGDLRRLGEARGRLPDDTDDFRDLCHGSPSLGIERPAATLPNRHV